MPYYIFRVTSPEGMEIVKNLELIDEFDSFKEAKKYARDQRAATEDDVTVKIMFAENQLLAEEQLLEHREKPIVMEHEK